MAGPSDVRVGASSNGCDNRLVKVIYKVTYSNGKIYIGMDLTETISDWTIHREILWESETATDSEAQEREVELIRLYRSNDPAVGYNRWPKH